MVGARGMALVDRPVRPKEVNDSPKARASLDAEYNALFDDLKAWDMTGVTEWLDVQAKASRSGKRIRVLVSGPRIRPR